MYISTIGKLVALGLLFAGAFGAGLIYTMIGFATYVFAVAFHVHELENRIDKLEAKDAA